jgi:lysylphosphatidylglycerol synthetase-like protein (DUF2156 family)
VHAYLPPLELTPEQRHPTRRSYGNPSGAVVKLSASTEGEQVNITLRAVLLIAAVIIFIIAVFVSIEHELDWIAIGLACATAAVLVAEMGWDRPLGGGGRRS